MKTLLASTILALALVGSAPVAAQPSHDASTVQAGSYAIDSGHTLVQFSVVHFGISDYFGTFPGATGTLVIDPAKIGATKLDVNVPVATVSTTNAKLDSELVDPEWLDAARFPAMRFVSTKVVRTGPGSATISGNLTLHGVTKPVDLKATFNAAEVNPMSKAYTLGFRATGVIKRTEFGVSKYAPLVSDETTLTISAAFEKKAG